MLRSIIRKTSPMSCSSSDLEICTSEQCLFEWRMLEYCTCWLAGSPSCWSYNSQEIASLISHLLQKDFLLPALNRELFQFLISLAVTCHLVTGAARWNDLRLYFILQKRKYSRQEDEDESIQAFVFEKAKRLGYGLRIIPRVRDLLFGRNKAGSRQVVREKRKLRDPRARPSRVTAHVFHLIPFNFHSNVYFSGQFCKR